MIGKRFIGVPLFHHEGMDKNQAGVQIFIVEFHQ